VFGERDRPRRRVGLRSWRASAHETSARCRAAERLGDERPSISGPSSACIITRPPYARVPHRRAIAHRRHQPAGIGHDILKTSRLGDASARASSAVRPAEVAQAHVESVVDERLPAAFACHVSSAAEQAPAGFRRREVDDRGSAAMGRAMVPVSKSSR